MNVRRYGSGPYTVAVIHGGPGAPGTVAAIARELSKEYGVLEPIQTKASLEEQVNELYDVIKNKGELPITLIGHSWGAWLAFIVAAAYPFLVKKLVLVSSGPFEDQYVKELEENRLSRLSTEEKEEFNDLIAHLNNLHPQKKDEHLARIGQLVSKSDHYQAIHIPTDEQDIIQVDGDIFQSVWAEASTLRKTGSLLALGRKIKCPVYAIHGNDDPHPAKGVSVPLKKVLTNFQFYLLAKCGHTPWKEQYAKDAFYQIVREILNRK